MKNESALTELPGVEKMPAVNPYLNAGSVRRQRTRLSAEEYVEGIRKGDRTVLSRAITLVESTLPEDQKLSQQIIEKCLPYSGKSFRLGITGVPGAGKSTFIEALGLHLVRTGHKTAILAIDPSSERSKGSILGDKTRMEELSGMEDAFIRPSPSAGSLGGVARKTREAMVLCEAAGFTHIIIETVGVGQSETEAYNMTDYFLLLQLPNLGDELQGIKRGIMEMADGIAINKSEGDFKAKALAAQGQLVNALRLFPPSPSGWKPQVQLCAAKYKEGVVEVWQTVEEFERFCKANGSFEQRRRDQLGKVLRNELQEQLLGRFYHNDAATAALEEAQQKVYNYQLNPYLAASSLAEKYFASLAGEPRPTVQQQVPPQVCAKGSGTEKQPKPQTAPTATAPAKKETYNPLPDKLLENYKKIPHFEHALAVDAACSGNPGTMEYQGVEVRTGKVIFRMGPFPDATNNIGEFLAIVHGLGHLNRCGLTETPIYSDSVSGMAWVRKKKANTKIKPTAKNRELLELIARAENWLLTHSYRNPVLKWETDKWGEIPADFGRK